MYQILSGVPTEPVDGHVDVSFERREGWVEEMGATVLPILFGDEHHGPFVVMSYIAPTDEQMPLSFAHAHASDNWRISVRGTTNMGRDAYEQGQFRSHDGGVPYASDNFAWGPDGGYGIIMFADRRGFAIRPVKAEIAEVVTPQQEFNGAMLGIDMQDPCPGAPAIATTLGSTVRAHLDGGFDSADSWEQVTPGVRMAVGLAGEPTSGPVILLLDCDAGAEALGQRSTGTESVVAPVSGSVEIGAATLAQGDVRVEEADAQHERLIAGPEGAQLVVIVGDRRALGAALEAATWSGAVGQALAPILDRLQQGLVLR
ncbi:MAG TPA: hypothetical protein PLP95_10640 [Microthrixaceae bacterium]|nr:hypothetical protein [Microthrixaceae bacterium]